MAGLLMSLQVARNGEADPAAVRRAILAAAVQCDEQPAPDCRRLLAGRLNILRTLAFLLDGESTTMSKPESPVLSKSAAPDAAPFDEQPSRDIARQADRPQMTVEQQESLDATSASLSQPVVPSTSPADAFQRPVQRSREKQVRDSAANGRDGSRVYVLGQLSYDLGSEARRDALRQRGLEEPNNQTAMLEFLAKSPWEATGITWVLEQESTPIYALQPAGPFARETYEQMRELLRTQIEEEVSQVSIPGILDGGIALMNGHVVQVIAPDIRGMFGWSTAALIEHVLGERPDSKKERTAYERRCREIANFLERIYYELSNMGVAPQERAVNFAATNIYQVASVYEEAIEQDLKLDGISLERSPVCRPGSDCWDVKLTLFDPKQRHQRAREVYRLTVDVSEVIPVTVGKLRHWSVY
jgi:cyanobactin maturation PatA/PatG family protease